MLRRVFVFNYSFDRIKIAQTGPNSPEDDDVAALLACAGDPQSVIIFPPEGLCEGGSMIEVHLQEVMGNAGVMIVAALEKQMAICEEGKFKNQLPIGFKLATHNDEYEMHMDSNLHNKLKQAIKKKPIGRIRKWMGDLSLQVNFTLDHMHTYDCII